MVSESADTDDRVRRDEGTRHSSPLNYELPGDGNKRLILMPYFALLASALGGMLLLVDLFVPQVVTSAELNVFLLLPFPLLVGVALGLISIVRVRRSSGRLRGVMLAEIAVVVNGLVLWFWTMTYVFFVM